MKLFGGAIEATLPSDFYDASEFRDVPDNQEMYVGEVDALESGFIVELCEPVLANESLEQAFQEHIKDIHHTSDIDINEVNTIETLTNTVNDTTYMGAVQKINDPRKGRTLLVFGLFRLKNHDTDVVITQSVVIGDAQLNGAAVSSVIAQAKESVVECAVSFRVLDSGLFDA